MHAVKPIYLIWTNLDSEPNIFGRVSGFVVKDESQNHRITE